MRATRQQIDAHRKFIQLESRRFLLMALASVRTDGAYRHSMNARPMPEPTGVRRTGTY